MSGQSLEFDMKSLSTEEREMRKRAAKLRLVLFKQNRSQRKDFPSPHDLLRELSDIQSKCLHRFVLSDVCLVCTKVTK